MAPEQERRGPDVDRVRETLHEERTEVEEAGSPEAPDVDEPDVEELDRDPAYDPDDEDLKGLKGG